jgi:hypothetical protein
MFCTIVTHEPRTFSRNNTSTIFNGVLPMPLRRFVAERLLRRTYPFPLGHCTFYSARTVARPAKRAGFHVKARKYRDSPIVARVSNWALSPMWRALLERYAFDFLVLEKRR